MSGPTAEALRERHGWGTLFWTLSLGFLYAVLQFCYFFLFEAFVSSQAISFFISLFFWLVGFLTGLTIRRRNLLLPLTAAAVGAYYVALLIVTLAPFNLALLPALGICVAASGISPGYFFPNAQDRFPRVKYLLFHENNGFILGILFSSLGAVFFGQWLLSWSPLLAGIPAIVLGVLSGERLW